MLFLVVCSVPEYQPSIISCFLFHIALSDPVIHNINRKWHHWMFKHRPVKQAQTYHWPTPALSLFWALRFYMTSDLTKEGLNIYTQPHVLELEELGSHVQEELAERLTGGLIIDWHVEGRGCHYLMYVVPQWSWDFISLIGHPPPAPLL